MWFVYMLRCGDGSFYVGATTNVERRVREHQSGRGAKYTRSHPPVTLAYCEEAADKGTALRREYALKQLTHAEKEALASGTVLSYEILDGAHKMKAEAVARLLHTTYWAADRSTGEIERSMQNSFCFGIAVKGRLVGFARVISDCATTYYLCDVVVDPAYRNRGLGAALLEYVEAQFEGLRGILITRDAHALYRKFGYEVLEGRAMVKGLNC